MIAANGMSLLLALVVIFTFLLIVRMCRVDTPLNSVAMVIFAVVITATVFVGWSAGIEFAENLDGERMQQYYDQSEQWCQDRGGEVYHANVIGNHGGLHCQLPDGRTVHMDKQIEVNQSA